MKRGYGIKTCDGVVQTPQYAMLNYTYLQLERTD